VDKSQVQFEQKAELKFAKEIENLFVSGDYVYLISDSLFIIDISDPVDPVLVSKIQLEEPSNNNFC